jgi:hypothetical protein
VRWQRGTFFALRRWSDLTQAILQLYPAVVPTVSLGRDYTDNERATFFSADRIGPFLAPQVPACEVHPAIGAVEILAAWISRDGGALNVGMFFDQVAPLNAPEPIQQSAPGVCNAVVSHTGLTPPWPEPSFEVVGNTSLLLPVAGTIVERGFRFTFGGNDPGQVVSIGVLLRNVGGP